MVVGAQRIAGFGPGRQHVPDVGARIAERADLPVENRQDLAPFVDDAVPETEVAVDDGALDLFRDARREGLVDAVDDRQLPGLRRLELRVPPLQLTADELVASRQVAEPDRVDIDRVQLDAARRPTNGRRGRGRTRRAGPRRSRCR